MLETQATERLCKDAPPGIPMFILYRNLQLLTSPIKSLKLLDCWSFEGIQNDYIKKVISLYFSLARLKA